MDVAIEPGRALVSRVVVAELVTTPRGPQACVAPHLHVAPRALPESRPLRCATGDLVDVYG